MQPSKRKRCKKGSYGCKDQLLINQMLLKNRRSWHRNLNTAWIDYREDFDKVPQTGILKVLQIYQKCPTIIHFWTTSMKK